MAVAIRPVGPADAAECGLIIHDAFAAIADQHNFPRDFPSVEVATGVASMLIAAPGFYGVVAEEDGHILGSNFLDERSPIAGVGPITVDPAVQSRGTGRRLMEAVIDRARARKLAGIRLVQDGYHNRSLSLYTKLGFATREPLSLMQGPPLDASLSGYAVRPATTEDAGWCNALCRRVHGFERSSEVTEAIAGNTAMVIEHLGRITGYTTQIAFFGHTVGETNDDLKALIGAAPAFGGPGFLLPTRNHDVFRWCLERGLRLVKQTTLMSIGLYNEPAGAWLPSVLY
ncbi:MAG: GNAT family N-acetyltransferase [Alphaproteobacteria bacterium]|nr:GNAT family N-acetyltransferase [Alphaproteobacteria bacterium]